MPQGSLLGALLFLAHLRGLRRPSHFQASLFAGDTYLAFYDKCLETLEHKANYELPKIDEWLKISKLLLNFSKSCYMFITNYPRISCKSEIQFNQTKLTLKYERTIKYLRIYIDEHLKWSTHIHQLSLQLAQYAGIFCKIRNWMPLYLLCTLYHCFILSRIQYGITVWGKAAEIHFQELTL